MDELLDCDFAVAEKDRLYRCLDRALPHKDDLCKHLVGKCKTLFDASFDVLLYDLTRTYFEGSLIMPRHTEPQAEQKMILQTLKLTLPPQPPPRIRAGKVEMPIRPTT